MNPVVTTLLTALQCAGHLLVFAIVLSILTYCINRIVHNYWSCKITSLNMTRLPASDVASMFQAAMEARNGKQTVER